MAVVVEISNQANLKRAKDLLGTKTESETVDLALEIVIKNLEVKSKVSDLPEDFFEDLFEEESNLSEGESIQAVLKEREESLY